MKRGYVLFGAFVMMTMVVLTGCTDAIVGPEDSGPPPNRVVEATDAMTYQPLDPDAIDAIDEVEARLAGRFFQIPPIDTTDSSHDDHGRLAIRFSLPPPFDSTLAPPVEDGRLVYRFSLPPVDTLLFSDDDQ